ncbi:hypothetical protein [Halocatena salina]|uniref:Uncharacterized protein n=1 Tax=Halocatena salina TaxID=2934340 RepID=A0A8U0A336_9EURY|nr:hypothetical protein [Halocatena salina]UPM43502.1 hypothetical protein MW046_03415 [Halocatena salina]
MTYPSYRRLYSYYLSSDTYDSYASGIPLRCDGRSVPTGDLTDPRFDAVVLILTHSPTHESDGYARPTCNRNPEARLRQ